MPVPKPRKLTELDISKLEKAVEEYMDFMASGDYNCDRSGKYKTLVFEKALEAFYGASVWKTFINPAIEEADIEEADT